ncbi:MAG: DUF3667 domain-containing protein [Bacteroidales bacterium]|nr:DUF3667 domain-containing protein [Bacteroidales bacterium]
MKKTQSHSHGFKTRFRAFRIWQKLGYLPWTKHEDKSSSKGGFTKGAFDSIPFLNDDAKRTFVHLLLRPGYMIRDYINGDHERFLAPLTSLIIFYAFFALLVSIVKPDYSVGTEPSTNMTAKLDSMEVAVGDAPRQKNALMVMRFIEKNRHIFSLDKHPEDVDSPVKASLAAFEGTLRSQGVYLFLGNFLMLWMAMYFSLKKRGLGWSASAAAAAYVLCQFCFFMLFTLIISFGGNSKIGFWLMAVLLMFDYCQLFEVNWKSSLRMVIKTGLTYILLCVILFVVLISTLVVVALVTGAYTQ